MDSIKIRRATLEDRKAVLRINENVYDGQDHLPFSYDELISSQEIMSVVMVSRERIVAFLSARLVDEEQTVVTSSGRIHPDFEGKGLMNRLTIFLARWGKSKGATSVSFTMGDIVPYTADKNIAMKTKLVLVKNHPMYIVDGNNVNIPGKGADGDVKLAPVSDHELTLYFKTLPFSDYLFPQNRIVVNAVPFKLLEGNISLIRKETIVGFSDFKFESGKGSGLLSFGAIYKIQEPKYRYMLDIFGTDSSSLKAHIDHHLRVIHDKASEKTLVLVLVPEDFELSAVDEVFKDYGIDRTVPEEATNRPSKCTGLHLYEWLDANVNKL